MNMLNQQEVNNCDIRHHNFCFNSQNSAENAVVDSKRIFTELVRFIEMRSAKIIEKIEAYQKADLDQGADLQEKLLLEITELKRRDGVQERLLQTEDNIHFLQVQPLFYQY